MGGQIIIAEGARRISPTDGSSVHIKIGAGPEYIGFGVIHSGQPMFQGAGEVGAIAGAKDNGFRKLDLYHS